MSSTSSIVSITTGKPENKAEPSATVEATSQPENNERNDLLIDALIGEYEAKSIQTTEEHTEWARYIQGKLVSRELINKWYDTINKRTWRGLRPYPGYSASLAVNILHADWENGNHNCEELEFRLGNYTHEIDERHILLGAYGDLDLALEIDKFAIGPEPADEVDAERFGVFEVNSRNILGMRYYDASGEKKELVFGQLGHVVSSAELSKPLEDRRWVDTEYVLVVQIGDDGKSGDLLFVYNLTTTDSCDRPMTIPTDANFLAPSLCNRGNRFTIAKDSSQGIKLLKEGMDNGFKDGQRVEINLKVMSEAPPEVVESGVVEYEDKDGVSYVGPFPVSMSDWESD